MKLRSKSLFIITITAVGLVIILLIISRAVLLDNYRKLEEQSVQRNVERVVDALNAEISNLDNTTGDWSAWDDTYAFVQDGQETYIQSNLLGSTFETLRLNLIIFINDEGQLVYRKAFDLRSGEEIPVPEDIYAHISTVRDSFIFTDPSSSRSGLLLLDGKPTLIAARPILTSERQGPIRGTLIFGRYLDEQEVKRLGQITHLDVTVGLMSDPQAPQPLHQTTENSTGTYPVIVEPMTIEAVAGYTLANDIYKKPAFFLGVQLDRDIYQQGLKTLNYLAYLLIAISLAFGLITLFLMEKVILSRVANLNESVRQYSTSGNLFDRLAVKGKDEVASLGNEINKMLSALEKSERELRESERRNLLRAIPDQLFVFTREGKCVGYKTGDDRLGNDPADNIVGSDIRDSGIPAEKFQVALSSIQRALDANTIETFEYELTSDEPQYFEARVVALNESEVLAISRNVTERVKAQHALNRSERLYRSLFESANDAIFLIDLEGVHRNANQKAADLLEYKRDELIGKNISNIVAPQEYPDAMIVKQKLLAGERLPVYERTFQKKDGSKFPVEINASLIMDLDGSPLYIQSVVRDITQRKRSERDLKESEERYRQLVDNTPDYIYILDRDGRYTAVNRSVCMALNRPAEEILGKDQAELGFPEEVVTIWRSWYERVFETGELILDETTVQLPNGSVSTYEVTLNPIFDGNGEVAGIRGRNRDISVLKRAEKELHRVNRALLVLSECNQALVRATDERELLKEICRIIVERGKYRFAWVGYALEDGSKTVHPISFDGYEAGYLQSIRVSWSDDELGRGPVGSAIRNGQPVIVKDTQSDPNFRPWRDEAQHRGYASVIALPLFDSTKPFGALAIYDDKPDSSDETEFELLKELASDLAYGVLSLRTRVQHEKAEEKIHHQLQSLAALRAIDLAITSSLDLRVVFDVLLDKVIGQLHLDAACVLLLNPHTQILEYSAGRGFRTQALQHTNLRLGEGYAGLSALERRIINIPNLQSSRTDFLRSPLFSTEGFVAYYAIPLIAKGVVQGVMEVFQRSTLDPDNEWLEFLEALAGQAAIALDNASLFSDMQRSNTELTLAYDTTIEGWSKALDLRDKETEGHSQRVTEMTVKLARAMGVSDAEMVHIRRGALLHDIGKMGIPDQILLKPGKLTEEEWEIMRKHPVYAYELLSPIQYLRLALDIPYCHHEKWDGSGYPRGLKGEQIPLAARIFAIVDVWDALRSDRPYRPAWPVTKILDYLRSLNGTHLDPKVLEQFLEFSEEWKNLYNRENPLLN